MATAPTIKVKLDWDGVERKVKRYYFCGIPVWKIVEWKSMPNNGSNHGKAQSRKDKRSR